MRIPVDFVTLVLLIVAFGLGAFYGAFSMRKLFIARMKLYWRKAGIPDEQIEAMEQWVRNDIK